MKFKELEVGEMFEFQKTEGFGLMRGPWVKVGARTYVDQRDYEAGTWRLRHKVGSINVGVERR